MTSSVQDRTVLVVGRGSGIARAVTLAAPGSRGEGRRRRPRRAGARRGVRRPGCHRGRRRPHRRSRRRGAGRAARPGRPRGVDGVGPGPGRARRPRPRHRAPVVRRQGARPAPAGQALRAAHARGRLVRLLLGIVRPQARPRHARRRRHERRGGRADPRPRGRTGADPGERGVARHDRHRRLRRAGGARRRPNCSPPARPPARRAASGAPKTSPKPSSSRWAAPS